jgi:hypothetical protein
VLGPRGEPMCDCGLHYNHASLGPISRYCTRTSGPQPSLQLLFLHVRLRLEECFSGECKYGNCISGIPVYFPFLPHTYLDVLLPYA